jgi:preprotein translocase subunit SecA
MIDNVNKEVISFLFKICQHKKTNAFKKLLINPSRDYTTKMRKQSSESANQEAMQTQQRQVTETITRDMPKSIAMTT